MTARNAKSLLATVNTLPNEQLIVFPAGVSRNCAGAYLRGLLQTFPSVSPSGHSHTTLVIMFSRIFGKKKEDPAAPPAKPSAERTLDRIQALNTKIAAMEKR